MNIFTSYFAKIGKIDDNFFPISISRYTPKWLRGKIQTYSRLAPSEDLLSRYKVDADELRYTKEFNEYLSTLNPHKIVDDLEGISGGRDVVLLCYERSEKFCHRHLVSDWLVKNGYECYELSQ